MQTVGGLKHQDKIREWAVALAGSVILAIHLVLTTVWVASLLEEPNTLQYSLCPSSNLTWGDLLLCLFGFQVPE